MIKEIIPQFLMVFSLATILWIVGRKFSVAINGVNNSLIKLDNIKNKENSRSEFKKIRDGLLESLEKFLRRIKILFLKADSKLLSLIGSLRSWREKRSQERKISPPLNTETPTKPKVIPASSKSQGNSLAKEVFSVSSSLKEKIKSKKISFLKKKPAPLPVQKIDIAETKRIMIERQERALIKRISLNPHNDEAYVELGRIYKDIGNVRDALASFRQALKINKGNILAKKMLKEMEKQKPI